MSSPNAHTPTAENAEHACHYCGTTEKDDLRPYGPGGSWVCFPCATATPEREQQAKNAFGALLDGAAAMSPDNAVMIGTEQGPRPVNLSAPPAGGDGRG
ncbi:hypothetical protein [Nocardioides aquiterrae]|uniref:Uncharacterized protein n=1 Tax=Nocardioides aquiterrae TaxID=203799 RepID=A0ABP4F0Z6_9ACTN